MSREDVIRRIVERDIQKLDLSEDVIRVELPKLHQDACDFFGTWDTALQYSGISGRRATKPRAKRIWKSQIGADVSPEAVVRMIRKLCLNGYRLTHCKLNIQAIYLEAAVTSKEIHVSQRSPTDSLEVAMRHLLLQGLFLSTP